MTAKGKRVLILVENLPVPFDRRVWMEATALHEAGYSVSVICPRGGKYKRLYEVLDGITIYRYPLPASAGLFGHFVEYGIALPATFALSLVAKLHRGFDVIQSANPPDFFFLIALFFKVFGVAFVFDHHDLVPETCETRWSGWKLRLIRSLCLIAERWTFRTADRVISTNESYRRVAIERGRVAPEHVAVVRSGPRSDRFTPVAPVPEHRNGREFLVCYLGVMGPNDGLDLLLRSIAIVIHDLHRRDIQFTLIGAGDMLPSLQALAKELSIEDFVRFTGRIPDEEVIALISTADIGVAPDPKDLLNDLSTMNKIIEYMALGKPLVAFDLREARVSAGDAAVYAVPNETRDFAAKIVELLADPAKRAEMGRYARERFESVLAWEHQREALLSLYSGLLGGTSSSQAAPVDPVPAANRRRPLRILFLNHNVVRAGGTFFRAFDIARYLARRGHSVTVLSISDHQHWGTFTEEIDGVQIVHTPDLFWGVGRSGWDPWDTLSRMKYVLGRRWDIVHAWDSRPAVIFPALAARYLRHAGAPTLFIDWCDWWGRGGTQLERGGSWLRYLYNAVETFFEESFRRFADGTTVISQALFDRATKLRVPAADIRILPQGCDPIASHATREEARAELGLGADEPIFITVGVLNTSDAALLFRTVPFVRSKLPAARFVIIGRNRATVPAHLAGAAVQELGYVPDETLSLYLSAADALVVPLADTLSSRARWPSKVNSALTHDLPVVVTSVGDLPRLLQRTGAALVAPPDPESFAASIVEAATNRSRIDGVRTAARDLATEVLPWSKVIDGLETYYYEVFSRQHPQGS